MGIRSRKHDQSKKDHDCDILKLAISPMEKIGSGKAVIRKLRVKKTAMKEGIAKQVAVRY